MYRPRSVIKASSNILTGILRHLDSILIVSQGHWPARLAIFSANLLSRLSLFTPSITRGLGYKNLEAQLMTIPPYAVACKL